MPFWLSTVVLSTNEIYFCQFDGSCSLGRVRRTLESNRIAVAPGWSRSARFCKILANVFTQNQWLDRRRYQHSFPRIAELFADGEGLAQKHAVTQAGRN